MAEKKDAPMIRLFGHKIHKASLFVDFLVCWGMSLTIFALDLTTPSGVAMGVLYAVPVLLSLWEPNKKAVYVWTVTGIVLVVAGYVLSPPGGTQWQSVSNRALSILVVCYAAILVIRRKELEEKNKEEITAREKAGQEVRVLPGLLSLCASCKKIRNDEGHWIQIEEYIRDRSEAEFSHSVCPECAEKLYPNLSRKSHLAVTK
jgi:hypothetical protein